MLKIIVKPFIFVNLLVVIFGLVCAVSLTVALSDTIFDSRIPINYNPPAQKSTPKNIQPKSPATVVSPKLPEVKISPDYKIPVAQNGLAPIISTIPTKQPVVFLGIDDGSYQDVSEIQALRDNNIKASLYLAKNFIASNPEFFRQVAANGSLIENHTLNHYLDLHNRSYSAQKAEICGGANYLQAQYGRRPVFYRPPGGSYNSDTLRAANDCGMKAVVTWIAKANGGSMQYQIGNKLRPGDIVLMHFRPEFKQDLQAFTEAVRAAGLQTVLLEDWLDPKS